MARITRERKLTEIEKLPNDAKLSVAKAADLIGVTAVQMYRYINDRAIKNTYTLHTRKKRIVGSEIKRFCRVN